MSSSEERRTYPEQPEWLEKYRDEHGAMGRDPQIASREDDDMRETNLLRDVAFNRHSMNDGHHVSPLDNDTFQVGADNIIVKLVQGIDEEAFKRTLSMATRATIGIDLTKPDEFDGDWEEMLRGGLQTALETQVLVFAVSGVSRTCTHQLVRSRRASFHQQSQRASYYGEYPDIRIPESVWRNEKARIYFLRAAEAAREAYQVACALDISYQDARYILPEGTTNYIMCEYTVREFIDVFAYRGCSMFSWEIVHTMREMRRLLIEQYPWLAPYVKISCEKTGPAVISKLEGDVVVGGEEVEHHCTFQGWESVEGQCDFPWAHEEARTFKPTFHKIGRRPTS